MPSQGRYKVISNRAVRPDVHLLRAEAPELAQSCRPGQFAMLSCAQGSDRLLRRPISLHAVRAESIDFLFALVGEGTRWLSQQGPGQTLDVLGPMGSGVKFNPGSSRLLLVAGGLGIAPLAFLTRSAAAAGRSVRLLVGAKSSSALYLPEDLPPSVLTLSATEDGSAGSKGMVTALLPEHAAWADQIFVCGPLPMYRALALTPDRYFQGKPVQVSLELRMGCGLGFCYACTLETSEGLKQVCRDGPVFDFDKVVWKSL